MQFVLYDTDPVQTLSINRFLVVTLKTSSALSAIGTFDLGTVDQHSTNVALYYNNNFPPLHPIWVIIVNLGYIHLLFSSFVFTTTSSPWRRWFVPGPRRSFTRSVATTSRQNLRDAARDEMAAVPRLKFESENNKQSSDLKKPEGVVEAASQRKTNSAESCWKKVSRVKMQFLFKS